jgi:histidinol-phosphate aminotransferase
MNPSSQLTRRNFVRVLGSGVAYASLKPSTVFTAPRVARTVPSNAELIRLSANENPYGPSPAALKAMTDAFSVAWRYPDEHADALVLELARVNGVNSENILLGNGSGEVLKLAAAAFTGPNKRLVVADPTFEAIMRYARVARGETTQVPLTTDYRHDLPKMLGQSDAGLVYICNPNNPTASITPKEEIRTFLSKAQASMIVLVDEAYHHYVESPDYESAMQLTAQYPNLIVARTFSKIYGMAGLRCGYCVGNAALLGQMRQHQTWDSVNIMALAAANASLADKAHVEQGRKRNTDSKKFVYGELEKLNVKWIPSEANFMMIDLGKPARPISSALRGRNIEVGRIFPALPNFLRVTIGTRPQMESFVAAFREVIRS